MIPKFSKVLVATDCSDTGNRAVPFAYAAVDPGGEVHLLHIIEHQNVPSPLMAHYATDQLNNPEKRREVSQRMEGELRKLIPKAAQQKGVTTQVEVVFHPSVGEGILKEIGDRKIDQVVMGSHGHSALMELLMGSVSEKVLDNAKIPVLLIPIRK